MEEQFEHLKATIDLGKYSKQLAGLEELRKEALAECMDIERDLRVDREESRPSFRDEDDRTPNKDETRMMMQIQNNS